MNLKSKISKLLITTMLFTLNWVSTPRAYADTFADSAIDISKVHKYPLNVLIGPDDMLYVSEYRGDKIVKMDKNGKNPVTLATGFNQPVGMVFDSKGNLYVAEYMGSKITKVSPNGTTSLVKSIGGYVSALAIDSQNKLFAIDYTNGNILKMNLDGSEYTTYKSGLSKNSIIGMTIDAQDNLYVTDRTTHKVLKVPPAGRMSDFIKGIDGAQSICIGEDGFFYVSGSNKRIEKIDLSGKIVRTFNTGNVVPRGLYADKAGYIYFGDNIYTVRKIVGFSETANKTSIALNLVNTASGTVADPSAFTITGASTNLLVTNAVVSGSKVILTLDKDIHALDSNLKVNYTKTGTNNLLLSGTTIEFDNFENLSVKNNILSVLSVVAIPPIKVTSGTSISAVSLPSSVKLNLSNSTTLSTAVAWNDGTPVYDGNTPGTYVFSGTFGVNENISNPNDVEASASVIVLAPEKTPSIDSVEGLSDIGVVSGTPMGALVLPNTVTIHLSNDTTSRAAIVWDGGMPAYEGNTPGTYVFTGALSVGEGITNTNDLKASVKVVVGVPSIVSVASLKDITVSNGTAIANIGLPNNLTVNLNNGTTTGAAITWNNAMPIYNGSVSGTYTFNGTITSGAGILNPSNLNATIHVIVQAEEKKEDNGTSTSEKPVPEKPAPEKPVPEKPAPEKPVPEKAPSVTTPPMTTSTTTPGADVIVNGIKASAGQENTKVVDGRVAKELTVNSKTINTMIDQALKAIADSNVNQTTVPTNNVVRIPVTSTTSEIITIKLTGDIIKRLDDNQFSINIETNKGNFILPAQEMKISEIAKRFNLATDLQKIVVDVQINTSLPAVSEMLNTAMKANGNMEIVSRPLEFKITAASLETKETVEVNQFASYVERAVLLPSMVDETKITTGVLVEPNGQLRHMPTKIFSVNNNHYANIQSLTNSDYSVVYNPVKVASVEGHWAKTAVNDLASRLIIDKPTTFDPNAKITRGEFATMLTKALGIYRTEGPKIAFKDVKATDPNAVGIAFAAQYNLISGDTEGNYKPDQQISRQEAMVIFAKAMTLTGVSNDAKADLASYTDATQVAAWAKTSAAAVTNAKVMTGIGNNKLGPKATVTASEAAYAVRNLLVSADMINK